ncbi:DUF6360 family protein [Halorussus halophilus]|uniref:DUF6360 family protein n=1 Tax=Halorussus halophilus TaxID=2650975 RepID=UPI0017885DF4|nr:DUF6360 family protein [Halorussus halophilus]
MADRLMKVNAYTTLDLVDATVTGHGFEQDAPAVVNATAPRKNPDRVQLQVELDNMQEDHLPAHMEEFDLSPEQARKLADDLRKSAAKVEEATDSQDVASE